MSERERRRGAPEHCGVHRAECQTRVRRQDAGRPRATARRPGHQGSTALERRDALRPVSTYAPRMDLAAYRRLVRDLPMPTRAQRESFPLYVANAHSWYKKIHPLGPGMPFVFFLDPAAGLDRVQSSDGSWATVNREEQGFHHAALPTQTYRDRFGHLAFANAQALQAGSLADGPLRLETGFGASVIGENGARWQVPEEVEAGTVRLTGMIHPYANQPFIWSVLPRHEPIPGIWPEESGGVCAFTQIQARCREILADRSKVIRLDRLDDRGVDAVFADLVEPERRRQRRLMLGAIERLVALLDLSRTH